jgi:glycosyltransferase involved in cell wall biosynthesis
MADIVLADNTASYDGRSLGAKALGATESSVIYLTRELARRGHSVCAYTRCSEPVEHDGVQWRPLGSPLPRNCDLYVAVQHTELLDLVQRPQRRALWVVWEPKHLEHYTRIWRMWRYRPVPVLTSVYQEKLYAPRLRPHPPEVDASMRNPSPPPAPWPTPIYRHPLRALRRAVRPGRARRLAEFCAASLLLPIHNPHIVIPLGLPEDIRGLPPLVAAPGPRAIFASNPERNLRRLVEIWAEAILPRVPNAVLDIYGIHNLGDRSAWQAWEGSLLPPGLSAQAKASVCVHPTVSRRALIEAMRAARVMLYLGHQCEAFCVVLAEAQALGIPAVVAPVGAVRERVIDGVTGFIRSDPAGFADAAVDLLRGDALWRRQHLACLREQQGIGWAEFAERFDAALLGDRLMRSPGDSAAAYCSSGAVQP